MSAALARTFVMCPLCLDSISPELGTQCRHCATLYHCACLEIERCLVVGCPPPPPPRPRRRWALRFVEVVIVIAIIGVLAAIAVPNFKTCHEGGPIRACYANQKTVVGAIEMYNLDKNTKRTTLDAAFFQDLKSGGYLQSIPNDPRQGPGTSDHYRLSDSGNGICCTLHGAIQ